MDVFRYAISYNICQQNHLLWQHVAPQENIGHVGAIISFKFCFGCLKPRCIETVLDEK